MSFFAKTANESPSKISAERSVGFGNVEDGEHYYEVRFTQGCNGQTSVRELARDEQF